MTLMTRGKAALLAGGWYRRRLRADRFPGVLVLCYHGVRTASWQAGERAFANLHIDRRTLEDHCRLLAATCDPIALDDWRTAMAGGTPLPARPVLMTFDDGYRSVHDLAAPLLKRYGIRGTVFVCTESIRRQQLFWYDDVARREGEAAVRTWRALPASEIRRRIESLATAASGDDPLAPMTVDHVKALAGDGFDIGVHTTTHLPLSACTPAEQRDDLASCQQAISRWIGRSPTALAYPFGEPDVDYTRDTVQIAAELGFDQAFTTRTGFATVREAPLERSRFLVLSAVSAAELAHRITYAWRR